MTTNLSSRRAVLAGLGGLGVAGLGGCVTARPASPPLAAPPLVAPPRPRFVTPPLAPIAMRPDRITKITVCLRPFREAGPRLDVERVGDKRVVHNYGHGGSGWSLAWGSSSIAAGKALEGGTREVAVIGCGALGLTSALLLQRAGAKVTIYAADRTPYTRSARATGTWSPDSRIADADKVDAAFPALWDQMARTSYAAYQTYLGLPGDPVQWTDRYSLFDAADTTPPPLDPALVAPDREGQPDIRFFEAALPGLAPRSHALSPQEHPFAAARARMGVGMQFNVAELAHLLTSDFLREGGRIETMTFHTPADLARLKEPVVVNCTGYGARALWNDRTVTPVRGQIAWLAPQPEVHYGVYYRHVTVLPRPDGIVVQYLGQSDMWGYGLDEEVPSRPEAEAAIATIAPLFAAASPAA
ncbi:MAG: FAD-dependent oxidoreductase [Caulobacter sp.]|nr:FAD-dependent oxidoreductase [Caulobacter sp.]